MAYTKRLELTDREAEILEAHWLRNMSYEENGTFGDGEELNTGEYRVAKKILQKMLDMNETEAI